MIKLLDQKTRELIAAGEVVERPASVVKELVENAVDSGATQIFVRLKNNGLDEISVTDNGCGIAFDEIETAFLRHATSKIADADDLNSIHTLGFRGEALPSISAVSKTTVTTKREQDENGSFYSAEGGVKKAVKQVGCPDGTTISVKEIFYNTPARMKFLKSDVGEGNAASAVVEQLALAHPEISFSLDRDGKQVLFTPGDNRLLSAIFAVFPRSLAGMLTQVDSTRAGFAVNGYICRPEAKRASRSLQYVFVNGRFVRDKTVTAAAEEAFRAFAGHGGFPAFVLNIEVSPELTDVNVHPAKTEIRFADERGLFSAVYAAVKDALGVAVTRMPADTRTAQNDEQVNVERGIHAADYRREQTIVDFVGDKPSDFSQSIDILNKLSQYKPVLETVSGEQLAFEPKNEDCALAYAGELFGTYIIATSGDTAFIIDKHAAHERILYEKFTAENGDIPRQILLSPVVVELSASEKSLLLENVDLSAKNGFLIEDFGDRAVVVREIPTFYKLEAVENTVLCFCEQLSKNSSRLTDDDSVWLFRSLACRAAVKAGDAVDVPMLLSIAKDIVSDKIPKYCPHGRPVLFAVEKRELERRFERG